MATVMMGDALIGDELRTVQDMLASQRPFEYIEAHIERTRLSEEHKSVLWLFAWFQGDAVDLARELGRTVGQ